MTPEFAPTLASRATAPSHAGSDDDARIAAMFDNHFESVWRFLRRLGVPAGDVDDHAQEVMIVAARKIRQIDPGKERAYLFGVACRMASDARKARDRHGEVSDEAVAEQQDEGDDPEMLTDQLRARAVLDRVLEGMPMDFRAVFVLAELDELEMHEIAEMLQLPPGTVASRLRRGREYFDGKVRNIQARFERAGGGA
jgi:RNA polymerase sigma-70 factor, ECF subfamily